MRTNAFPLTLLRRVRLNRGVVIGLIMLGALIAFELFNYSTTEFALRDLLSQGQVLGISWASVLAVAFCSIDFAGLARLFTPEQGADEPKEIWYLVGAWFLGASMNAAMTWWAVSETLAANPNLGNGVMSRQDVLTYVPIVVAGLVWLTRVLIIGTFSVAGERLFSEGEPARTVSRRPVRSRYPVSRVPAPVAEKAALAAAGSRDEDEYVPPQPAVRGYRPVGASAGGNVGSRASVTRTVRGNGNGGYRPGGYSQTGYRRSYGRPNGGYSARPAYAQQRIEYTDLVE